MSYGVKRCKFFKNGDINFPGLSMIISENIYRNYQSLLNELSTKLVLSTGPVNYLFDYDSGKIILSLDEVKTGKYFIASTSSYLKETQYIDNDIALNWKGSTSSGISGLSFQSSTTIKSSNTLTSPVSSSSLNNFNSNIQNDNGFNENTIVNTSFQNDYCIKPRIINVIRLNEKSKHANFLLNHRSATSLEYVLNELSLFPQLGKVDKLYTKDGKKVAELKDLFGASLTFFAAKYFEKFNITEPNSKPMRINNNKDVYTPKSCSPIVSSKMSIKGGSANTTPISYEKNRNNEKEKYRIITTLGEGNYSRIQKAQICSTGQFVVLKRIKRTMMKPIHTNESNILRDLENPYIIKMFDFIESPSEIIIVLDFSQIKYMQR